MSETTPISTSTPLDLPGLDEKRIWLPLEYLNFYRLILSVIFVGSFFFSTYLPSLGSVNPIIFQVTSLSYLIAALGASFIIHGRWLDFKSLTYGLASLDIIALTSLMHASGGIETGLGMLIVVAIAGNSLILGGRAANLFAAIAVIAILGEQVYVEFHPDLKSGFTQAGILGAALFATAFLAEKESGDENLTRSAYMETIELADSFGPIADIYKAMGYMGLSRLYEKKGLHDESEDYNRKASRLTSYAFILDEQIPGSR